MRCPHLNRVLSLLTLCLAAVPDFLWGAEPQKIDFLKQIRPIFESRCYECHGPENKEGGLRLHRKGDALAGGDSGAAIVPGDAAGSLLIKYVTGEDPEQIMPPNGENLSAEQIDLLKAWIDAGADWPDAADQAAVRTTHWAYEPLQRPAVPGVIAQHRVQSPIDAFVLAQLEPLGLTLSPAADRYTLIRRLYYDLLGLPPTPAAVARFVSDSRPEAYADLVDELLDSPHFGERWGRHWLDKARYADSDGYEKDNPRYHAWRYRDWVIEAINRDLPFDQFTVEQLAGDLLPEPTADQLVATGFNRQTLTNTEGGTDQEEFRCEAIFDRVETLGTVWLGLTIGCARCHSHKYDDISQREYYQLFAFFNNADEANRPMPTSAAAEAQYLVAKAEFDRQLAERLAPYQSAREALRPRFVDWLQWQEQRLAEVQQHPLRPLELAPAAVSAQSGAELRLLPADGSWLATGERAPRDVYELRWTGPAAAAELSPVSALAIEVIPDPTLPAQGPGRADHGNFVLSEVTLDLVSPDGSSRRLTFVRASADYSQKGFEPNKAIDGKEDGQGWAIGGALGQRHRAQFELAEPVLLPAGGELICRLSQQYDGSKSSPHLLGRFKVSLLTGRSTESLELPAEILDLVKVEAGQRKPAQLEKLLDYFAGLDPEVLKLRHSVDELRKAEPFNPQMPVAMLQERQQNRRTTRVFKRGEFLQPLGEVQPGTLAVLHPGPVVADPAAANRLDLARWLVSPENPLTPRVVVNEIWSHLLGRGIVGTLNDFGVRGERPTHPELLDWLATEFLQLGWSRKQLIREIVLSGTYQQSSVVRPDLQELDPQNRLLARQNRFRVEGEIVRDLYLAVSGLLEPRIGGPSVFPELPPGIEELSYANNFKWGASDWNTRPDRPFTVAPKDDRYRRGMYTFFKRTAAHPNLVNFDCPDANTTCMQRGVSNTPLQALQTLNNATFVEAARTWGQQLAQRTGSTEERLRAAFEQCVARQPTSDELAILLHLLSDARSYYAAEPAQARQLTGSQSAGAHETEQASWILVARSLLNLDEFVTRE
jgi:mono/diheme cytochrome c family protein